MWLKIWYNKDTIQWISRLQILPNSKIWNVPLIHHVLVWGQAQTCKGLKGNGRELNKAQWGNKGITTYMKIYNESRREVESRNQLKQYIKVYNDKMHI